MSGRDGAPPAGFGVGEPVPAPHPRRPRERPDRRSGRHRRGLDREARCRHHPAARRLAGPLHRHRRQGPRPAGPRPPLGRGRGPARPTRPRCANRRPARRATASSPAAPATPGPATSTTSPSTSRSTTADHPARPIAEPRTAVPDPPPGQDPHRLDLQEPRRRRPLRVDAPTGHHYETAPADRLPPATDRRHRRDATATARLRADHPAPTPTNLTAPRPRPQPGRGHRHAPQTAADRGRPATQQDLGLASPSWRPAPVGKPRWAAGAS